MQNNVLSIWLWGQELGRIYWDKVQSRAVFEYNSAFISAGMDVAPLSASIHSVAAGRPILGNKDALYQGLPPFIADSLPDKWGSLVFECWTYLKAQGIDDYWADKIEESLASLLPERFAARMTHHLPTLVPDYTTDDGFLNEEAKIRRMDCGER